MSFRETLRIHENSMNSLTNESFVTMIIIVSYLKVLIKRSTHLPLTERITRWLEGDYKKELWKVALEPDV